MVRVVLVRVEAGLLASLALVGSILKSFSIFIFFIILSLFAVTKRIFCSKISNIH